VELVASNVSISTGILVSSNVPIYAVELVAPINKYLL
jgi:hypothetical protein